MISSKGYTSSDGGWTWNAGSTVDSSRRVLRFDGLKPGAICHVEVHANNATSELEDNARLPITTPGVLGAPSGATMANPGATAVDVYFVHNTTAQHGSLGYLSADGISFVLWKQVRPNERAIRFDQLVPNTRYWMLIRAYNAAGKSADSDMVPAKTRAS